MDACILFSISSYLVRTMALRVVNPKIAMSKKNNYAKINDLRDILRVLKKFKERSSKLKFSRIGPKDDLIIVGIGDASFQSDDKAVGGVLLFLSNSSMTRATPIYWK